MNNRITDYLNRTALKYADKTAFVDGGRSITFEQLRIEAYKVASVLCSFAMRKVPVAVFMDKQIECVSSMFGIAYSGNFYTVIDVHMPVERIEKILDCLKPEFIITDKRYETEAKSLSESARVLLFEDMMNIVPDEETVEKASKKVISTDVLYVLFTSGSTGTPKGVIISHQAVISYTDWVTRTFDIDSSTVFGNQTPFYFIMSGLELYQTIAAGCTTYIIPKMAFSFPVMLMQFLKKNMINTLYWVPTALCMLANSGVIKEEHLPDLRLIMFGGEVMPTKQLNMWMDEYPNVKYVNQYGPTEMTDICAYYVVDRHIPNDEPIPIGHPSEHMELFILDADSKPVQEGEIGELCGRGPSLASGYYHDQMKTEEVFVQNPLNSAYEEKIYRTGDLVTTNERGELVYVSRKDFQIKHLGHRIELGEIESVVSAIDGIERVCCLYDKVNLKIVLVYIGSVDKDVLLTAVKNKVPEYMVPGKIIKCDTLPYNLNGKIDREKLKEII